MSSNILSSNTLSSTILSTYISLMGKFANCLPRNLAILHLKTPHLLWCCSWPGRIDVENLIKWTSSTNLKLTCWQTHWDVIAVGILAEWPTLKSANRPSKALLKTMPCCLRLSIFSNWLICRTPLHKFSTLSNEK